MSLEGNSPADIVPFFRQNGSRVSQTLNANAQHPRDENSVDETNCGSSMEDRVSESYYQSQRAFAPDEMTDVPDSFESAELSQILEEGERDGNETSDDEQDDGVDTSLEEDLTVHGSQSLDGCAQPASKKARFDRSSSCFAKMISPKRYNEASAAKVLPREPNTGNARDFALAAVSAQTVAELLRPASTLHGGRRVVLIDCRSEAEYEAGTINGAINITARKNGGKTLQEQLEDLLRQYQDEDVILIFFCEYSQYRSPAVMNFLRQLDREHNGGYVKLAEIYLMNFGYKAFFEEFSKNEPRLCGGYVHLSEEEMQQPLKEFERQCPFLHRSPKRLDNLRRTKSTFSLDGENIRDSNFDTILEGFVDEDSHLF